MKRGDIYMVSLDPVAGNKKRGHRPGLIVSPDNFNAATKAPVVVPITNGGAFAKRFGFGVDIIGIKTTGVIHYDQPRTLDVENRGGRRIDSLPAPLLDQVLAKLATIFE